MGITGILLLCIVGVLGVTIYAAASSLKQRNWKKAIFAILAFAFIVGSMYMMLAYFITSM